MTNLLTAEKAAQAIAQLKPGEQLEFLLDAAVYPDEAAVMKVITALYVQFAGIRMRVTWGCITCPEHKDHSIPHVLSVQG